MRLLFKYSRKARMKYLITLSAIYIIVFTILLTGTTVSAQTCEDLIKEAQKPRTPGALNSETGVRKGVDFTSLNIFDC